MFLRRVCILAFLHATVSNSVLVCDYGGRIYLLLLTLLGYLDLWKVKLSTILIFIDWHEHVTDNWLNEFTGFFSLLEREILIKCNDFELKINQWGCESV